MELTTSFGAAWQDLDRKNIGGRVSHLKQGQEREGLMLALCFRCVSLDRFQAGDPVTPAGNAATAQSKVLMSGRIVDMQLEACRLDERMSDYSAPGGRVGSTRSQTAKSHSAAVVVPGFLYGART